jgi:hypothetical protein
MSRKATALSAEAQAITFRCSALNSITSGFKPGGLSTKERSRLAEALWRKRKYEAGASYVSKGGKTLKYRQPTQQHVTDMEELPIKRELPPSIGDGCKTAVRKIWYRKKYHYDKPVFSKEMTKGTENEDDSKELLDLVLPAKQKRVKWPSGKEHRLTDGTLAGTPDYFLRHELIVEVKTCWDLDTFYRSELDAAHFAQVQGYMRLLTKESGKPVRRARVLRTLVNTPKTLVDDQKRSALWHLGVGEDNEEYIEAALKIELANKYDDIPEYERVKIFHVEWDEEYQDLVDEATALAREYYDFLLTTGLVPYGLRAPDAPLSGPFGAGTLRDVKSIS